MKEINLPSGEYLLVEVPEDSHYHTVSLGHFLWMCKHGGDSVRSPYKELPKGDWTIIGKADELTEEQWTGVVPAIDKWSTVLYYNYTSNDRDFRDIIESAFKEATESARTLITYNGYDFSTTLILRKLPK